jgi:hypothetical protein
MGSKNFFETVGSRENLQTTFFGPFPIGKTFKQLFLNHPQSGKPSNNFFGIVPGRENPQTTFLGPFPVGKSFKHFFLNPETFDKTFIN